MKFWKRDSRTFSVKVLKNVLQEEMQSIIENKERASMICDGKVIPIPSEWINNQLRIYANSAFVKKHCGHKKPWIMHTHALHTSRPSRLDFDEHRKSYDFSNNGFCTIGADGIECFKKDGSREFNKIWSNDDFAVNFKKLGGRTWEGTEVFCDHTKKKDKYDCNIVNYGREEPMDTFDQIVTIGGSQTTGKTQDADFSLYTHSPNERVQCYAHPNTSKLLCKISEIQKPEQ